MLELCGGPLPGRTYKAAFSGVSNAVLAADYFGDRDAVLEAVLDRPLP